MNRLFLILILALIGCSGGSKPTLGDYVGKNQSPAEQEIIEKAINSTGLMKAIVRGDVPAARQLIFSGVDVNENVSGSNENPITPLLAAVVVAQDGIVQDLLSAGASNSITYRGYRVLDFALLQKAKFTPVTIRLLTESR